MANETPTSFGKGAKSISNWKYRNAISLTTTNNCFKNHIIPHVQLCQISHTALKKLLDAIESQDMHLKEMLHILKTRENKKILKYIYNFRSIIQQILAIRLEVRYDKGYISIIVLVFNPTKDNNV